MKFKDIKPQLVHFDNEIMMDCPFYMEDNEGQFVCVSNHPDKQEKSCHAYDCPFCYEPSMGDIKPHDMDLYEEYRDDYKESESTEPYDEWVPGAWTDCDYVIQIRELK